MRYIFNKTPDLREYEKEMLRDIGCIAEYQKGEVVLASREAPETLCLIESGWVRIQRCVAGIGGDAARSYRRSGDIIGLDSVLCGDRASFSAVAITSTSVVMMKKESFFELLTLNPFFLKRVIGIISCYNGKRVKSANNLNWQLSK